VTLNQRSGWAGWLEGGRKGGRVTGAEEVQGTARKGRDLCTPEVVVNDWESCSVFESGMG
jgi:hypothetical protein